MGIESDVFAVAGWNGLFSIFVTLGCVVVVWIVLQEVKWDKILRDPRGSRARMLQLLIAVGLGYLLARFVLDYWNWVGNLKWLFDNG
ncbi:DUF1146 family protein [Cohnella terricola]|uniref:DUF1146 domain-containing protein n=1 Tax=Cohnella terricola TaxID=1289167 RepID=A0A559JB40_9BACL|nr:DUF1146 domain-containing protein [Cohnella terricola]TVX97100.1 DUF1146 domain-containing protein [Cohnella terricola]